MKYLKIAVVTFGLVCIDVSNAATMESVFDDLNGNVIYGGPAAVKGVSTEFGPYRAVSTFV